MANDQMMLGLNCIRDPDLRSYVLGELPPRVDRLVADHLAACRACETKASLLDNATDPMIRGLRRALGNDGETRAAVTQPATVGPAADPPQLPPGYEAICELGRGGTGVVYLARQRHPNRLVALKMLLAGGHSDAEGRARFVSEADAIARLQHPNIVQVYEVGEAAGLPYLALEFIDGGSLAERLRGELPAPKVAAHLVRVLAAAVHFAHQNGVVHRDLKPGNILLSIVRNPVSSAETQTGICEGQPAPDCPQIKIADFGLAKHQGPELTATGDVIGTPSYMAPEQADGGRAGPPADIWAIGVIFYECLTGRLPFRGGTSLETLDQVRTQEVVSPERLRPGLPRDLCTICLKCLQRDPRRRYDSAGALADDLGRVLSDRPPLARRTSRWEHGWRWCRRNPLSAALATALALFLPAALAVVTLLYWQSEAARHQAVIAARRADEKSELTRTTVDDLIAAMSDQLRTTQDVPKVRRTLYLKALSLYERLADEPDGKTASLRLAQAKTQTRLAEVENDLNHRGAAREAMQRAEKLIEALAAESPDDPLVARERWFSDQIAAELLWSRDDYAGALARYRLTDEHLLAHMRLAPADASPQTNRVTILTNIAALLAKTGKPAEAVPMQRQAVAAARTALTQTPYSRYALAHSLTILGTQLRSAGNSGDAQVALEEAAKLFDALVPDGPSNPIYREGQGDNLHMLSMAFGSLGNANDAIKTMRRAVVCREKLAREMPTLIRYRAKLANAIMSLISLLSAAERYDEVGGEYDRAIALTEQLLSESPRSTEYRLMLAQLQSSRGEWLQRLGKLEEALAFADRGIAVQAADPSAFATPTDRQYYGIALRRRGSILAALGRNQEAFKAWDRALVFLTGGERVPVRVERAKAIARTGDVAAAAREAEQLLRDYPEPQAHMAQWLATLFAVLSANDKSEAAAAAHAAQAVALVRRCHDQGISAAALASDKELAPLQSRPDFQAILASAATSKK